MRTIFIFIINILLVGGGFIAPEKTIKDDIKHYFKRNCKIIDIIPLGNTELDSYIDTLIFYNGIERSEMIESHYNGYKNGIISKGLYESLVESTNNRYLQILKVLHELQSDEHFSKQTIYIYEVVYTLSGYESGQIIQIYLLNKNNRPIGYIGSDGNYLINPPHTGIICKTPEDFYNRRNYYEL